MPHAILQQNLVTKPPRGTRLNRSHPFGKYVAGGWLFNEGGGSRAFDISHPSYANFNGNARWHPEGVIFTITPVSKLDITNRANLNPAEVTMSAWVRVASSGGASYRQIMSKDGNSGYRYRVDAGNTITFLDRGGSNVLTTSQTISAGVWTNVVAVGSLAGLRIYINGILSTSNASAYGSPVTTGDLTIGANPAGDEVMEGEIRMGFVFGKALTASEVYWAYREPCCFLMPQRKIIFYSVPTSSFQSAWSRSSSVIGGGVYVS
jgi:hypothetical protein